MAPPWQLTAAAKRQARDALIDGFMHPGDDASQMLHPDGLRNGPPNGTADSPCMDVDQVHGILEAVSSRTVTATALCAAYISR